MLQSRFHQGVSVALFTGRTNRRATARLATGQAHAASEQASRDASPFAGVSELPSGRMRSSRWRDVTGVCRRRALHAGPVNVSERGRRRASPSEQKYSKDRLGHTMVSSQTAQPSKLSEGPAWRAC